MDLKEVVRRVSQGRTFKLCEFYYYSGDSIYTVCHERGFVICPIGFTRGKPIYSGSYKIWKMDLENTRANRERLVKALEHRNNYNPINSHVEILRHT